ncbi:STAS domain-containing protein [Streptomyces sp. NPDC058655]|uniref:STAS domain-containing protein n=1 Tax=unclassified Streptomyces TaxID=2593676 RepID=UPI003652E70F
MTSPSGPLRLTRADADGAVRIALHGNFDHQNADALLDVVTSVLAEPEGRRDLHLDCGGIVALDSSGLSTLLMVRRLTDGAGVGLYLHGRPPRLDRMLKVTGTLDHLTGRRAGTRPASFAAEPAPGGSEPVPARSGGADTTT